VNVDALIDGWQEAWSAKDPERFGEVCASGIQYEDPLTLEPLNGISALAGQFLGLVAGGVLVIINFFYNIGAQL
jgi:hypothetical protein